MSQIAFDRAKYLPKRTLCQSRPWSGHAIRLFGQVELFQTKALIDQKFYFSKVECFLIPSMGADEVTKCVASHPNRNVDSSDVAVSSSRNAPILRGVTAPAVRRESRRETFFMSPTGPGVSKGEAPSPFRIHDSRISWRRDRVERGRLRCRGSVRD